MSMIRERIEVREGIYGAGTVEESLNSTVPAESIGGKKPRPPPSPGLANVARYILNVDMIRRRFYSASLLFSLVVFLSEFLWA